MSSSIRQRLRRAAASLKGKPPARREAPQPGRPEVMELVEQAMTVLSNQGYERTGYTDASDAFRASVCLSTGQDIISSVSRELIKNLGGDPPKTFLASIVCIGRWDLVDNYHVVGMRAETAQLGQWEFSYPSFVPLRTFIEEIGDAKVEDYFARVSPDNIVAQYRLFSLRRSGESLKKVVQGDNAAYG